MIKKKNVGKTQLVLFDRSYNTSIIDVKMYGSALEENSSSKMHWIGVLTLSLLLKLPPRKLDSFFEFSFS